MSAKGKNFGVNVSATLDEARAAGDDGILYIPESEEEGVMVFGGKEYAAVSKGFRTYFNAKLNEEILNKYTVTVSHKCITRNLNSILTTNNNNAFEYSASSNYTPDEDYPGYAQAIEITLNVKYNNVAVNLTELPVLNFSSELIDDYIFTDSYGMIVEGNGSRNNIEMAKTNTTGVYKTTFYFDNVVTNDIEGLTNNDSVLKYWLNNLKYIEDSFNIECIKNISAVNLKYPIYFKPEFVLQNNTNNHESICTTLGIEYYNTSIFARKTTVNGTYKHTNSNNYLHIISTSNAKKINTPLGSINDIVPTKVEIQGGDGTTLTYYVYTIKNADTYTIS